MNILYLSPWFPFPPTNGSELRINAVLRGLAAEHKVTLISFQRRPTTGDGLRQAEELLAEVHLVPWREFDPNSTRARLGLLGSKPRSVLDTYSREMAGLVRQQIQSGRFDVVIASELGPAVYVDEFGAVPALIDDLELGVYTQTSADGGSVHKRVRHNLMWAKQRAYVRGLLPRFAACTVVSQGERALLRQVAPAYNAVDLIPNCINLPDYAGIRPAKEPATLIFTGAFSYNVNYEAMVWFVGEVYPLIRAQVPAVRLVITGDHADLPLPATENITLTGFVDDVKMPVAAATVSIVPIRQGGGTRLKILEAMALGTPIVSTSKGAEGLHAQDGQQLLMADTPQDFAAAVVSLLNDAELREQLVKNAGDLVRREYDWRVIMPRFLNLVDRVAGQAAGHALGSPVTAGVR